MPDPTHLVAAMERFRQGRLEGHGTGVVVVVVVGGLLEHVRTQLLAECAVGGLLDEASGVLYRLVDLESKGGWRAGFEEVYICIYMDR